MIKTDNLTPRQKKIAITIAALIVLYILFGFIGAPFIVRGILEQQVAAAIKRQVAVESVRVNPLTLSVTLRKLSVREPGGNPFADFDEVYVNLQTASLFKWALVLKTVRLTHPDIHLVRSGATTFNFSDIGAGGDAQQEPNTEATDASGLALAIYDARITGGALVLDDRVTGVNHRIEALDLSISDFSSRPADTDVYTLFTLAARVNGAALSIQGKAQPFAPDRHTKAEIGLQALTVPHYLPYVALPDNLQIASLTMESDAEIEFRMLDSDQPELVVAGILTLLEGRLADGNGDPFTIHPKLQLDILPSRVLTGELRFAEVESTAAEYFIKRLPSGDLYLPFLAVRARDAVEAKAAEDTSEAFHPVVTIDRLHLNKTIVHFSDKANSTPFTTTIEELSLVVENFGYNIDRTAAVRLALETDAAESLTLSGTASLEPLAASGELKVADIELARYLPYHKDIFEFKTVDGKLSLGGSFRFRQEDDVPRISLSGVHLDLEALEVVDEDDDEPLITLNTLRVADTTAELADRVATLGVFSLAGMELTCRREKDGVLNLVKAFVPAAEPSNPNLPAAPDVQPAASDQTVGSQQVAQPQGEPPSAGQPAAAPFVVNLNRVQVADVIVDVEDRVPEEPAKLRLNDIHMSATNLSTASGQAGQAELSMGWKPGGQVHVGGAVTINPLGLDLQLKVSKMDIRPLQPYLSEQADLIVTNGLFSTQGRLQLSGETQTAPAITYAGRAGLHRFASIDRKNTNDFLKWEALTLEKLEVGTNPTRLSIDQVSLADFFARVIVDADGSVNLASMFGGSAKPSGQAEPSDGRQHPEPAQAGPPPSVRIASVALSGGDVDFSDRFIKPNFNAKFHDLGGRVTGLESIAEKRADVLLEGMWANHAPVKITGTINPLIQDPYVDLNLNISDIELSPFSPYSGKYIGYILDKGKLTFNVAYLMENRRLEGKNSVFIGQLTLGDTVDSPDAVSLPIKMAVTLLKDREGNIELDLPVSGSLDDPEFRIGKVVLTVLKNIIVKVVTSPFAVLGALAGGGEELSYLDFGAGNAAIDPDNAGKIDKLAKILYERPGLNLDIQGTLAPEADSEALRAQLLENRLRAEKLQRMIAAGQRAVPLDEIVLPPDERQLILEEVFVAAALPAPLDASGNPVELTPEIMESLLRTHTAVTPDDLRKLANARAFAAKEYLLATEQVERERIFIVEPKAPQEKEKQEGAPAGRVVFSLK